MRLTIPHLPANSGDQREVLNCSELGHSSSREDGTMRGPFERRLRVESRRKVVVGEPNGETNGHRKFLSTRLEPGLRSVEY